MEVLPLRNTFSDPSATITVPPGGARPTAASAIGDRLTVGAELGGRYEILKLLGEGGMGAVYKARDHEVGHLVALKVIRPELANNADILSRFKQELILTRRITHKNVIRIFDVSQADGIKFITMEFVEGRDLHSMMQNGNKFSPQEAVDIAIQICRALDAAHSEGIVHRDLKPHNIMVEANGRVVVMDFGIARSIEQAGVTSTGALVGTPAYMSPEQARGDKADNRSDLFSFGIILYELLTNAAPYASETVLGLLLKRIQERPVPPVERDGEIPKALSEITLKCLTIDREQRYQTAEEISRDLEAWRGSPTTFRTMFESQAAIDRIGETPTGKKIVTPGMAMMEHSSTWKWIALSLAGFVVAGAGIFAGIHFFSRAPAVHDPVTLMIADISNHTGDPLFDGTLEPTLRLALEGASFISAYDRTRARDLGLPPVSGRLDEAAATRIAVSQGLGVVVSGTLQRQGTTYQLSLKTIQPVTGKVLHTFEGTANGKDQVLFAVTKLGTSVRSALGDSTSESDQLFALETLTAGSLESVHEYGSGMDALAENKWEEARKDFSQAIDLDMNFGLAYAGMAIAASNLRQQQEAEKDIRDAVSHIDRMTERERLRTRGIFYTLFGDYQNCTDQYTELIRKYPSDAMAHNNLGRCYIRLRNTPKAIEEMQRAVQILPNRPLSRFNLALYQVYASNFQKAAQEVNNDLKLDPTYVSGHLTVAYAALGEGRFAEAQKQYEELASLSSTSSAFGLADLAIYQGRYASAIQILGKMAVPQKSEANANRLVEQAYAELSQGHKAPAADAARKALDASQSVKIRFLAGRIFAASGNLETARRVSASLSAESPAEQQAFGKIIDGETALEDGDAGLAVDSFKQANMILNTWIGHFDLGRAYLKKASPDFVSAEQEFDECDKRRGESIELFLDDVPTFSYFPPVYFYRGLALEGMKSSGAANAFQQYLTIRGQSSSDPLADEARRHLGAAH